MGAIYELAKIQARYDVSKKCGKGHIGITEECHIGKAKPVKAKSAKTETKATIESKSAKPKAVYPLVDRLVSKAIAQDKGDVTIPKIPKGLDKNNPNFVRGFTVMKEGNAPSIIELPNSRGKGSGYHDYADVGATYVSVAGGRTTPKVVRSTDGAIASPHGKDYKVNLFGKNAGWKWDGGEVLVSKDVKKIKYLDEEGNEQEKEIYTKKMSVKDSKGNLIPLGTTKDPDGNDHPAIISVEGSEHHYTLSFDSNVKSELRYYKNQPSEPRNKFAAKGQMVLGETIGTVTRNGITKPVYDRISIEPKMEKDSPEIVQVKNSRKDSIGVRTKVWIDIFFD